LLRVSNINGDLGGTKVLQGGSRIVGILNPLNSLFLTGCPRGGGNGGGGLRSFRSVTGWQPESENKKLTKTVAKAEGKTAAKAKKRVAARIIEASNESEGEREWVETVKTAGRKGTKMRDKERQGKGTTSGDVPFYISSNQTRNLSNPKNTILGYSFTSNTVRATWSAFRPVCFKNPIKSNS